MVIKRTIASLKDRPHAERRGIAVLSALVIMLVLLAGWGVVFIKNMHKVSAEISYKEISTADPSVQDLAASASSTVDVINSIVQALSKSGTAQNTGDMPAQIDLSQVAADGTLQNEATAPAGAGDVAADLQAALQKK